MATGTQHLSLMMFYFSMDDSHISNGNSSIETIDRRIYRGKKYDFPLPKLITRRECMIIYEYAMLPRMLYIRCCKGVRVPSIREPLTSVKDDGGICAFRNKSEDLTGCVALEVVNDHPHEYE